MRKIQDKSAEGTSLIGFRNVLRLGLETFWLFEEGVGDNKRGKNDGNHGHKFDEDI